ncbi:MAG: cysteine--tRNA ligase [Candidatus Pacebacteria bacterium]|nr:cysteine--tRNA ligase [Candidatus Paceibacterota bacterium]MBP9840565.1 cysteine--tRNA ligase [Candidatus Paceibacterota bacterium]
MSWLSRLFSGESELHSSSAIPFFTNTLSGKKEPFTPLTKGFVKMYSCGPTVYSKQHIGNLKAPLFADLVARTLKEAGYRLSRVMNITDVGHLVGDGDHGEDKMAKGAREAQMTPEAVAKRYTDLFLADLALLNIDMADVTVTKATDYIQEQIQMIEVLEAKGFAYKTDDGVYFDTKKFPQYGKLGRANEAEILPGARIEKVPGKRNIHDFVLWRQAKKDDLQKWDSPWGVGNPGWHIECSAMIKAVLGTEIDIHTGGIDHIPTHHNNEIAQSEAANGKPLARYWLHEAFVNINDEKVAKSTGNVVYLSDVVEKGFDPMALRYFFLQAHYRRPLSFTWDALAASAEGYDRLLRRAREIEKESSAKAADSDKRIEFITFMRDDLSTPQALALLWDTLKSEDYSPSQKWGLLTSAESLLGLPVGPSLSSPTEAAIPEDIQKLAYERDLARGAGNYAESDRIRDILTTRGYRVEDSASGTLLTRNPR